MSGPPSARGGDAEHNILLRNRASHLRDRDNYYGRAVRDLESLVEKIRALRDSTGGLQQLKEHVALLALDLKRGLYHAILAAGGDLGKTRMRGISREEMIFSDYLKTMYSAARNIESHLSHELMLMSFYESEEGQNDPLVTQYIQQTKSYDQDIILRSIDMMVGWVELFNRTFLPNRSETPSTDWDPARNESQHEGKGRPRAVL